MTDKQIIIDGVDVSEWTDEEVRYKFEKHSPKAIRQIAFGLYKQLKRKEQACERLKETLAEIKEIAKIEYPKSLFAETFVEVINHCPYFDCGKCKCLENKEEQNCGGFI